MCIIEVANARSVPGKAYLRRVKGCGRAIPQTTVQIGPGSIPALPHGVDARPVTQPGLDQLFRYVTHFYAVLVGNLDCSAIVYGVVAPVAQLQADAHYR